ncbi:PRA1 family protein H [Gossypium australe]|uniref:PRA1 family protein H n=1 Tax=Gossypium australe TaxID=47621 RepID=A0A5B6U508_9ROSI|nr:PRA1 family protein H [Gossypium australe]
MASFGLQFCFAARDQQLLFSELRKPPLYSIMAYYPVDDFFVVVKWCLAFISVNLATRRTEIEFEEVNTNS